MNTEALTFSVFELPDDETPVEVDQTAPQTMAVRGIARAVSHVESDRNDPTGYYGYLLDQANGDIREASHMLMDSIINHKHF